MTNGEIMLQALEELFNNRDSSALERYYATPYLQHNPTAPDGYEAIIGLMKNMPPEFKYEAGMMTESGDLVMIHGRYTGLGPKPLLAVDIFRMKDGKTVEHWDVMQEEIPAAQTKSGRPMFG